MDLSGHAIRHARVPAHLGRCTGLRGTLERWLAARDLRRYGLPAEAIVLVRGLRVSWAQVAGTESSRRDDALSTALSGARRPALDAALTDSAAVVWFSDTSELLACMARDSSSGPLNAHWWWPALLHGRADAASAIAQWIAHARAVPRAVEQLQAMRPGASWFAHWSAAAQHQLLDGLARHYAMASSVRHFVITGIEDESLSPHGSSSRPATPLRRDAAIGGPGEPGGDASSTASAALRLQRLCSSLARDPAAATDLRSLPRQRPRSPDRPGADELPASHRSTSPKRVTQRRTGAASATRASAPADDAASRRAQPAPAHDDDGATASEARAPAGSGERPPAWPSGETEEQRHVLAPSSDEAAATSVAGSTTVPPAPAAASRAPTVFETGHGGLFFLINAALQLGLYGDFSRPQQRGLAASPYRFLYEAGRDIGKRRFLRDPLATWLRENFVAADSPRRDATRRTRTPAMRCTRTRAAVPAHLLASLRARLALALGLGDARRLASLLLRLPARVCAGGERIDVFFALRDLPLAVRLAGLDRDPGWLPAAGRDLRFHFD